MAAKTPVALTDLKLPLIVAQVLAEKQDGTPVRVEVRIDDKGKLDVNAYEPLEPSA